MTLAPGTPPLLSTIPPEILLLIIPFLEPVDQHELSQTCRNLRSHIGLVPLRRQQAAESSWRKGCRGRGPSHITCNTCALLLPFYYFTDHQLRLIQGPSDRKQCLPCQEKCMKANGGTYYVGFALKWSFQEWIGVCPTCLRFVRCAKEEHYDPGNTHSWMQGGFDAQRHMLRHAECSFPAPTSTRSVWRTFGLRSRCGKGKDTVPLVADKIALLESNRDRFPTALLALHWEKPLRKFQGLLP